MSRETREKLSELGDRIFEKERIENLNLYRRMAEDIVAERQRERKRRARKHVGKIALGAACLIAAMFVGAILLADVPSVRAIRSGFEQAWKRLSEKPDVETYESFEALSRAKQFTLPVLTYIPEGFTLQAGVRYQEYDGAPFITLSYVKDDDYLTIGIEEVSDIDGTFDQNDYTLLQDAKDKISILSQKAPYTAEVYIGGYVYNLVGSLTKDEMKKVAIGITWPS